MPSGRPCSCGIAIDGDAGLVYNEEAFRHLLAVERERAAAFRTSFLLVRVALAGDTGKSVSIGGVARTMFAGLQRSVRDMDLVGWFRHDVVAGAVLTGGTGRPPGIAATRVRRRVARALRERLPSAVHDRVRVRVLRLPGTAGC